MAAGIQRFDLIGFPPCSPEHSFFILTLRANEISSICLYSCYSQSQPPFYFFSARNNYIKILMIRTLLRIQNQRTIQAFSTQNQQKNQQYSSLTLGLIRLAFLGTSYWIYRKLLRITMINKNLLLTPTQVEDIQQKNYTSGRDNQIIPGHFVNWNSELKRREKIVVIGAGMIGAGTALTLLKNGYNVILINREKLKEEKLPIQTDHQVQTEPQVTFSKLFIALVSMLRPFDYNQLRMHYNIVFDKYWLIWWINSFYLNTKNLMQIFIFAILLCSQNRKQTDQQIYSNLATLTQQYYDGNELIKSCKEFDGRFYLLENTEVKKFVIDSTSSKILGVLSDLGVIFADNVVISASLDSKHLCDYLGIRLPLLQVTNNHVQYLHDGVIKQISGAPMLCGEGLNDDMQGRLRMQEIAQLPSELKAQSVTTFHAITPDDLPIIGQSPTFTNVFLNTGHGNRSKENIMGAADVLLDIMEERKSYKEFSLQRYLLI